MAFIAIPPKLHVIRKARTKQKVTRTYSRVSALSRRMGAAVKIDLFNGIQTFKKKVSPALLRDAWTTKDYHKVMRDIPWQELPSNLEKVKSKLSDTLFDAGKHTMDGLPAPITSELRYDTKNPTIRNYVENRTGELIVNIQSDTQKIVQNAIARSFDEALTPRDVADIIKGSIGLYPQQEAALRNYKQGLINNGAKKGEVDRLSKAYEERLLDNRCMNIARTETRFASLNGQLSVWKQAQGQGLLAANAKKVWIVDGNPCEICEPMDGEAVGLYEAWSLNNGDVVEVPTESHPNCYCGFELDFGEPEETAEEGEESNDYEEAIEE